jgi:hypothetical protein
MLLRWIKQSTLNTQLHKLVAVAPYIKVPQVLLLVVAHCLLASRCQVKAGALLTLRRLKFKVTQLFPVFANIFLAKEKPLHK